VNDLPSSRLRRFAQKGFSVGDAWAAAAAQAPPTLNYDEAPQVPRPPQEGQKEIWKVLYPSSPNWPQNKRDVILFSSYSGGKRQCRLWWSSKTFSFEHDFVERDGCLLAVLFVLGIPLPEGILRRPE